MLDAVGLEVGWEVLVGVAPFVRADDPDLLAAQPLAQRLKDARLVHAADDPGRPRESICVRRSAQPGSTAPSRTTCSPSG